jgi:hypothetical protein
MRHIAVVAVIVFAALWSSFPPSSLAQAALSPGCAALNDPSLDTTSYQESINFLDFYAGDMITVMASNVPAGSTVTISLYIAANTVGPVTAPGTLTYTFSSDVKNGQYGVTWATSPLTDVDWTVSCTGVPRPPAPPPAKDSATPSVVGAGCDALLDIPNTAVVGAFVDTVVADWAPGMATAPEVTLAKGKTAWVLGLDESHAYYKILWGCQSLWVPVGAMGPNYDDVWHGTPLPTGVVD